MSLPTMKEPQVGEKTELLVGGGVVETVTILEINRDDGFILGQKNPDLITMGPSEGNRVRWPRSADNGEYTIDSEFIFFDDTTGIFAIEYGGKPQIT